MILFFFFILFLALENLLLPALIGPKTFLISPLFLAGLIIYGKNFKTALVQACIFLLVWEFYSGVQIGSFIIPFAITAVLYIWLNHFIDIRSGLSEGHIVPSLLGGMITLTLFIYLYSWLFIFYNSPRDIVAVTQQLAILAKNSYLMTLSWSVFFVILFRYVIRPK